MKNLTYFQITQAKWIIITLSFKKKQNLSTYYHTHKALSFYKTITDITYSHFTIAQKHKLTMTKNPLYLANASPIILISLHGKIRTLCPRVP